MDQDPHRRSARFDALLELLPAAVTRPQRDDPDGLLDALHGALAALAGALGAAGLEFGALEGTQRTPIAQWVDADADPADFQEILVAQPGSDWYLGVTGQRGTPRLDDAERAVLQTFCNGMAGDANRARAAEQLRDLEWFGRAVLDHSSAVIGRWGPDLHLEYVNDAIEGLTGIPADDFVGLAASEIGWPAEAVAKMQSAAATVAGTLRPVSFLVEVPLPGIGTRVYSTQVGPLYDGGPDVVGYVSIATDITDHMGLLEELRAERALLTTLIDDSPDVILRVDATGHVVFANQAWARVFGPVLPDPEGTAFADVARFLGAGDTLTAQLAEVVRQGTGRIEVFRLPEALGRGWSELRFVPERGDTGVEHVLLLLRDVTDAHLEEEALVAAAGSDPLTGLANRRVLLDAMRRQLATAARTDRTVGVLYLDLDHFKSVNDAFGHRAGDDLLRAVGQRLVAVVRPADLVGRQGGDEFIVLVTGVASSAEVDTVARRLLTALDAPVEVAGLPVQVSASIGVAVAGETGTSDPEELLRQADLALYEAKRSGRNRYVHFRGDEVEDAGHRALLAGLLDDAVTRGELAAYLQPEIDPRTGRVVALEALARWCRPGHAPEPAQAFLDLVHDRSVQAAIDLAVVEQAAAAVAELDRRRTRNGGDPPLELRVNLARETLRHDGVADALVTLFARAGVSPERVTVEFDNRDLTSLAGAELSTLDHIHAAGFSVGLDNVELPERFDIDPARRMRASRIAIIPSVVARLGDDELADALFAGMVLALANLGITVTAVGVEAEAQADVARNLGIRAQGRWFANVTAADAIAEAIDQIETDQIERSRPSQ